MTRVIWSLLENACLLTHDSSHESNSSIHYSKVPEVKDTVHKHSLLYHMTYWVLEKFPDSGDLYSELGPVTRASRTDFSHVGRTLTRIESECKMAWDYLR